MRDQQLKEFSEEVKRGFVEALGHKSSFHTPKNKINKKVMKIKDLKVGQVFQLEGLDVNGNTVYADCTLRAYTGMNKYAVESDGISIIYDGEDVVKKVYK